MNRCFHCGHEVPENCRICLHCQSLLVLDTVWPPESTLVNTPPVLEKSKLITGSHWGDFILCFFACLPLLMFSAVGMFFVVTLVLIPYIFFASLIRYPTFACGFGLGMVGMVTAFFILFFPAIEC